MSNTEHYDRETRLRERIRLMDAGELRSRLMRFTYAAPVRTIDDLYEYLFSNAADRNKD